MQDNFELALESVLAHEGGLVDDPQDPGGKTNFGISSRVYPDVDVSKLSREDAQEIYRRDYWLPNRCDELPSGIDMLVFDCAVNQGSSIATKILQRSVGAKVDGIIGPKTVSKSKAIDVDNAIREIVALRGVRYGNLGSFSRYGLGWMRRLAYMHQRAMEIA